MIILGIDPGLATLGYGVLEKDARGNVRAADYGVVLTPKEERLPTRLAILEEGVNKILDKFSPDEVAVEELFFSKNITTGIAVAHARGVALLACVKRCGRLFEYTPMQIKQALTGYGKAEKKQIQLVTANLLRLKGIPRPDDAADALAVALCHSFTEAVVFIHDMILTFSFELTKEKVEILRGNPSGFPLLRHLLGHAYYKNAATSPLL